MVADEKLEQLRVQPFRVARDFVDLHARLDIEIVADVTVLKIEIEQHDSAAARSLGGLDLNADLDGERAVAHAAGARRECYHHRLGQYRPRPHRRYRCSCQFARLCQLFLPALLAWRPNRRRRLYQALVVAGWDVVADEMKNSESRYSAAIETIWSKDPGALSTTGNRMQASSVSPPAVFGRDLVTSSIRPTTCTSGSFALMRRSSSLNCSNPRPH